MARATSHAGNLPVEASSFVGRRRVLADVRKKLSQARLISLVGPGGVGKTRLAIRIAADFGRGFRSGSWLVELAELRDPALVSHAVMTGLDLRDQAVTEPLARVVSYLRDKELLLILDNCEHLVEAAAQIAAELIRAAPGLRVIATSREPLSISGEHVVPVPPLDLPASGAGERLSQLRQNEAVLLFTDRAAAASGGFELTAANQDAVVDVCRRLDGLPLAIELAAVRTRALTVEQIGDRLSDRFGLLTGGSRGALPRHQTLRTTIEWSYDLLTDDERVLSRRLCVFAGRFTLDDVESVGAPDNVPSAQALDLLSSLVDKSLVMKEDAGNLACYRLHETMREFACLKLQEAGEKDAVELRCADYYRLRLQELMFGERHRLVQWLQWWDLEIDNIRAVLQWCTSRGDSQRGLDIATSLGWYWVTRANTEGGRWLDEFLASGAGDPVTRAWAHFIRGFLALLKADSATARPALATAVAAARRTGQRELLSEALSLASIVENLVGDRDSSRRLLDEAQATAAGLAYLPGTIAVFQARSLNGFIDADLDAVRSAASEGARLSGESGNTYAHEMMLLNLGTAELLAGDLEKAKPLLAGSMRLAGQIDDRVAQFHLLDALGCHAALAGQYRLAARLLGAAQAGRTEAGADVLPFFAPLLDRARDLAVAAIGKVRFETEFEAGRSLSRDRAVGLALGEPGQADVAAARDPIAGLLAKREADVARLVAQGLTNKQIGARLFISERTVDSHVRSILNKLGVSSRAQIAAWLASEQ